MYFKSREYAIDLKPEAIKYINTWLKLCPHEHEDVIHTIVVAIVLIIDELMNCNDHSAVHCCAVEMAVGRTVRTEPSERTNPSVRPIGSWPEIWIFYGILTNQFSTGRTGLCTFATSIVLCHVFCTQRFF